MSDEKSRLALRIHDEVIHALWLLAWRLLAYRECSATVVMCLAPISALADPILSSASKRPSRKHRMAAVALSSTSEKKDELWVK